MIQLDQWVSSTPGHPVRRVEIPQDDPMVNMKWKRVCDICAACVPAEVQARVAQVQQQQPPLAGIETEQSRHRSAALLQFVQQERKARGDAQLQVTQQQEAEAAMQAEFDELVHDFSIMAPAPASVECPHGASGDPFAADRKFFSVAPADASLAPGASVLNQGRSGTCTRYGLAAAITDNTNALIKRLPRDKRRHVTGAELGAVFQKG
eukprot:COSAG02_NODE_23319_length_722_cov_1.243981_1_plen_207_part_01